QGNLQVRFLPDPSLPWKQVPSPLRIPSLPLYHLVRGPPAVRVLCRRGEGATVWDGDKIEVTKKQEFHAEPSPRKVSYDLLEQESSAWMALTLRRNRKRNTTWSWQSTLPFA
ncbi:unnamed protein product, partial [Symbiodinium necroappetens]